MSLLIEGICSELNLEIISKCKAVGILTAADFVCVNGEELSKKTKVPFKDIMSIRHSLLKYAGFPQRADSLYHMLLERVCVINTGSKCINSVLNGGIYTGEVTEIHGPPGSGKTQFSLSVAANLLHDTEGSVLYLDTNCSFTVQRFEKILLKKSEDCQVVKRCLQRIKVLDVSDIYTLFNILHHVANEVFKMEDIFFKNLKLAIVDSITPLLSPCFGGKYLDGFGLMNNAAWFFKMLCSNYTISILVCNNSVHDKNQEMKASLGSNWMFVPSVCVHINKFDQNLMKLTVVKSCRKGHKECNFTVNENGIADTV